MKEASASCRASFLFRAFSVFRKSECDKIVRTGKRETMSILFFDIDNTLFSHKTWTIPDSAAKALEKAKGNGHQLFHRLSTFSNSQVPFAFLINRNIV